MGELNESDIKENYIQQLDDDLLSILLKDRSSGKNIIWATDNYSDKGLSYEPINQITVKLITGRLGKVIRPRIDKSKKEQQHRIKDKAEVFTPSWICNKQNNLVDNAWLGYDNAFNTEVEKKWTTNREKVKFPDGKTWQDYVMSNRMEITCGEAPYLVSRYDTVTGEWIDVGDRIGILDRKLRVISENVDSEPDWVEWAYKAYKATYGFEWQGDSLLIARENMLFAFIDCYLDKFQVFPIKKYLQEVAKILSWNIFQMDGLKFVIPNSCNPSYKKQLTIFDSEKKQCQGCLKEDNHKHIGIYCKIMDWEKKRSKKFISLIGRKKE